MGRNNGVKMLGLYIVISVRDSVRTESASTPTLWILFFWVSIFQISIFHLTLPIEVHQRDAGPGSKYFEIYRSTLCSPSGEASAAST
jgi:hypothetical protein